MKMGLRTKLVTVVVLLTAVACLPMVACGGSAPSDDDGTTTPLMTLRELTDKVTALDEANLAGRISSLEKADSAEVTEEDLDKLSEDIDSLQASISSLAAAEANLRERIAALENDSHQSPVPTVPGGGNGTVITTQYVMIEYVGYTAIRDAGTYPMVITVVNPTGASMTADLIVEFIPNDSSLIQVNTATTGLAGPFTGSAKFFPTTGAYCSLVQCRVDDVLVAAGGRMVINTAFTLGYTTADWAVWSVHPSLQ